MRTFSFLSLRLCFLFVLFFGMCGGVIGQMDTVRFGVTDTIKAGELFDKANNLLNDRRHEEALSVANECYQIYVAVLGDTNIETAKTLYLIGRVWYRLRNYENAISSWEHSLAVYTAVFGKTHPKVATTFNSLGIAYEVAGEFEKAIKSYESALSLRIQIFGEESMDVADTYNNLGNAYNYVGGQYDKAILAYKNALNILSKTSDENYLNVPMCYANLGACYINKEDFIRSIECLKKSQRLYEQLLGEKNKYLTPIYQNLSSCYYQQGDYHKAVEYAERSLVLHVEWLKENHTDPGAPNNNLGMGYLKLENFELAKKHLELSLSERINHLGENHIFVAASYVNLGIYYDQLREFDTAISFYENALSIYKKSIGDSHPDIPGIYYNIGTLFLDKKDFESGKKYLNEALNLSYKLYDKVHPTISSINTELGIIYHNEEKYALSEEYFSNALTALSYENYGSLQEVQSISQLFSTLKTIGLGYQERFLSTKNINHLYLSNHYLKQTLRVLAYYSTTLSPSSKPTLAAQVKEIYVGATTTNILLHNLTDSIHYLYEGFDFAERSKAMLLYEAMQETNALSVSGIPDSLLQQEYDLRIDIAYYDKKRQEKLSAGAADTDSTVLAMGDMLFDLNRRYETLKSRFETTYPHYYKAKYDLSTITLTEVQDELLQPGQSLVEYLVGDSNIYVILVRKDTFVVQEIKHDFPLNQWVSDMTKDGIYGYHTLPFGDTLRTNKRQTECEANYTRSALQLYEKLLAPVAGLLTKEVVILPDGVLGYLPFEALLTNEPKRQGAFGSYPYLLRERQISYCYSATLLREMRDKQHRLPPTEELLALAPFYRGDVAKLEARVDSTDLLLSSLRDAFGPLEASGEEVATITKTLGGMALYGTEASIDAFRERAAAARIIHLSTHGKADDRAGDYAYLAFGVPDDPAAFDKLYARDLYNFSLNAELVMLSACETGIGKLRRGEGIVSLARAFAYAGAKSIFTTLWKVNDEKTKDLTLLFYTNLQSGKPKDEALRQAKLDYLKKYKGKGAATHPFYWAGMIGIGDMGAIR